MQCNKAGTNKVKENKSKMLVAYETWHDKQMRL